MIRCHRASRCPMGLPSRIPPAVVGEEEPVRLVRDRAQRRRRSTHRSRSLGGGGRDRGRTRTGDALLALRRRQQAFALRLLAGELAGATNGLGLLASTLLRGLLVGPALLHLLEDAFALHLLLQDAKRLLDVVFTNQNLHGLSNLQESEGPPSRRGASGRRYGRRPVLHRMTAAGEGDDVSKKIRGHLRVRSSNDPARHLCRPSVGPTPVCKSHFCRGNGAREGGKKPFSTSWGIPIGPSGRVCDHAGLASNAISLYPSSIELWPNWPVPHIAWRKWRPVSDLHDIDDHRAGRRCARPLAMFLRKDIS